MENVPLEKRLYVEEISSNKISIALRNVRYRADEFAVGVLVSSNFTRDVTLHARVSFNPRGMRGMYRHTIVRIELVEYLQLAIAEFLTSANPRDGDAHGLFVCRIATYIFASTRQYVETHRRTINKMQRPDIMEAIRVALHKIPSRRHIVRLKYI